MFVQTLDFKDESLVLLDIIEGHLAGKEFVPISVQLLP